MTVPGVTSMGSATRSGRAWMVAPALALTLTQSGCAVVDRMTGEAEAREIRRTGVSASAVVLRIWDTGITLNENPVVGFEVLVRPAADPPFEARTRAVIGRLDVPRIQPGRTVPVRFDPNDRSRVAIDLYGDSSVRD